MSDMSNFFGGSGPSGFLTYVFYINSTTYTPQIDMWARVTCVGGGGGGGAAATTDTTGNVQLAMGGCAGGFVQKVLQLSAGTTYTLTIGSGGAGGDVSDSTASWSTQNGSDGTATTFSGTGITSIVADGGLRGRASITDPNSVGEVIELLSRTAQGGSGGDVINLGGVGGEVRYTSDSATDDDITFATGGGAVNCYGHPAGICDSGKIDVYRPTYDSIKYATGGAGVGGQSGSIITVNSPTSSNDGVTGAGGSVGSGSDRSSPSSTFASGSGVGTGLATLSVLSPQGAGGISSLSTATVTDGEPGGGGGANLQQATNTAAGNGGAFGGGGASTNYVYQNGSNRGGNGTFGGGGGAVSVQAAASPTTVTGGNGGGGLIYIEFLAGEA